NRSFPPHNSPQIRPIRPEVHAQFPNPHFRLHLKKQIRAEPEADPAADLLCFDNIPAVALAPAQSFVADHEKAAKMQESVLIEIPSRPNPDASCSYNVRKSSVSVRSESGAGVFRCFLRNTKFF